MKNKNFLLVENNIKLLMRIFSLLGLVIMVYLTYIHYANASSFCDISENVSCDVVTTSLYSEVFGVPMSLLGVFYFGFVFLCSFFCAKKNLYQTVFLLTVLVLFPSLYLTAMEFFVIDSICILCESSKVLMLGILVVSYLGLRAYVRVTLQLIVPVFIAGVVLVGVTFFAQTGNVVKKDYSAFVECLNKQGVVYYKSFKCSNCKKQERMLGEAYKKLNSVECHPEGRDGQPELCLQKGIDKTPTFILKKDGAELKRIVGLQQLEKLADFASCSL